VGETFFCQHVERQGGANVIRYAVGLVPKVLEVLVCALVGLRAKKVRRIPQIALALMSLHELQDLALEVCQHFNLGSYLAL
jgi:hypothetical protein